jgi:hypothetical protein
VRFGEKALLDRPHCDLAARAKAQFGEQIADVHLGRTLAYYQRVRDLAVGAAARQQNGDLALAQCRRSTRAPEPETAPGPARGAR